MAAPWEKYQQPQEQHPWMKYQGKEQPPKPEGDASMAALEGFGQGAAFGYLPQLQAAAEPLTNKLFATLEGKEAPELPGYTERRDENIRRQERLAAESPGAYYGGMIGGTVAGGAGLTKALPKSLQAMSPVKQAVASGAIQGAIQNPGDVQGEIQPIQPAERLEQAALGGAVGGVAQKAIGGLATAAPALTKFGQEKAFKSSGAMLKDFRKAFAKDKVHELGKFMIDNDLVKPGMSFDDVASKSQEIKKKVGEQIGKIYEGIGAKVEMNPELIEKLSFVKPAQIKEDLLGAATKEMPIIGKAKYLDQMGQAIDEIAGSGKLHDVRFLNDAIGELDDKINYAKRIPDMRDAEKGYLAIRRVLRDKVNELSDTLSGLSSDKKTSAVLKDLNKKYGHATEVNRIAADRVARENANRFFSPSDYAAGIGGAIIGGSQGEGIEGKVKGAAAGAGLGLANKAARLYLNPVAATGAAKLGQMLEGSVAQKALEGAAKNPQVTGAVASKLANTKETKQRKR